MDHLCGLCEVQQLWRCFLAAAAQKFHQLRRQGLVAVNQKGVRLASIARATAPSNLNKLISKRSTKLSCVC